MSYARRVFKNVWDSGRRELPIWSKKFIIKELERIKGQ